MPGLKINAHGLFRKNSRFSAIKFRVNPNAAKNFVPKGIGVNINKPAMAIPIGESVETIILRKIQNGLLCIE